MTERRRFEFSEGSSNKFWEVWVDGDDMKTCYGKIGTSGSTTLKGGGSPEGAVKLMNKLIAEKTKKGYAEAGGGGAAAPAPAAAAPQPAAAAPAKKAPQKAAAEEEGDEDEGGDEGGGGGGGGTAAGWRRFEVDEKFWMIKIDGSSHTVKYGKIGANGAEKTKDFGDAAAAKKDYDKLVKEKTGKGYEELEE